MTAGPIARAFRLLKRTSVSAGGVVVAGDGVTEEDRGGVVAGGEAVGAAGAVDGSVRRTSFSCAGNEDWKQTQRIDATATAIWRKYDLIGINKVWLLSRSMPKDTNPK
jgi:hypothetical protein